MFFENYKEALMYAKMETVRMRGLKHRVKKCKKYICPNEDVTEEYVLGYTVTLR